MRVGTARQSSSTSGRPAWADLRGFAAVDDLDDPTPLIQALTVGKASPAMASVGAAIVEELALAQARSVLDLGCGLGTDAVRMASVLPPGGQVTGVDVSRTMVAEARRRAAGSGAPVRFVEGSAYTVPFADETFDRCRAQSLLQHLDDAAAAIREIARVLKVGGRVAAFEFDLGTGVLDHPDRTVTRAILDYVTDSALQGWIGRQLPRLYGEAGFVDVMVKPQWVPSDYDFFMFTMRRPLAQAARDGVLTARQVIRWLRQLEDLQQRGHYLGGSIGYLVSATKTAAQPR
jgi:SAM-dependent methyltransferase